jgi:3-hydroxyacyl-CoA dehydrogenase
VYLAGYGFPVQRGGPMFYAGRVGLGVVVRRMQEFGWKPAKLITQLAASGQTFEDAPVKKQPSKGRRGRG